MKKQTNKTGFTFKDSDFDIEELSQEELDDLIDATFKDFDSDKFLKKERNTKIIGWIAILSLIVGVFFPSDYIGGMICLVGFVAALIWTFRKGYIKFL